MPQRVNPAENRDRTREQIGYVARKDATPATYDALGFMSGLEVHQQLATREKLFCRCPTRRFQRPGEYDAEVIRHMRPTLSEMGEYDGTALMERKTRKNIIYRIKGETACTYDIDDTPPFPLNQEALRIAVRLSLMLKLNVVGELHITRKQYLDGSIPTGFQRTGIIGIEGEIPLSFGTVRIMQLSLEEDSCREVSDVGHWRVYTTDRLGTPLIEAVTYPDMKTPDQVAEAAQYIRFLCRSSGMVYTGMGAAREDVNVSIAGGTRVEIKGVSHIRWIPELVHNEAFRQKALLEIKAILAERISDPGRWSAAYADLEFSRLRRDFLPLRIAADQNHRLTLINLPRFGGVLSFFTQPNQTFADELRGRLKVIACLEHPNMLCSEEVEPDQAGSFATVVEASRGQLATVDGDAQVLVWGPSDDVDTAIETITERCRMAMMGVPNETRKSFADGTTVFERVLPGPDRMYPDTDSPPVSISEDLIARCGRNLPTPVAEQIARLDAWGIPRDTYHYILCHNLTGLIGTIIEAFDYPPRRVGTLFGHSLKHVEGAYLRSPDFTYSRIHDFFAFIHETGVDCAIMPSVLPAVYQNPNIPFEDLLAAVGFVRTDRKTILARIPALQEEFDRICTSPDPGARVRWIMGRLRSVALGNMPLAELKSRIEGVVAHV